MTTRLLLTLTLLCLDLLIPVAKTKGTLKAEK